jgi:hypothetical protein
MVLVPTVALPTEVGTAVTVIVFAFVAGAVCETIGFAATVPGAQVVHAGVTQAPVAQPAVPVPQLLPQG